MLDKEARILRARLGGYALHAKYSSKEITGAGRAAFLAGFAREVDPDGVLPEEERLRRAESALRAHMTRLALKSKLARQKKKAS